MSQILLEILQWMRKPEQRTSALPLTASVSRSAGPGLLPGLLEDERRRMVPLPALYGRLGVLPDYFTDELVLEDRELPVLREFFDIFNNRFGQLLFDIWQRYHFFTEDVLQPKCHHARREAFYLNCLVGAPREFREDPDQADPKSQIPFDKNMAFQALRWHKISLYRRTSRSAEGLMELLRVFFPQLDISLQCMVPVNRSVPESQQISLKGGFGLGQDGVLGTVLRDLAGGIRITVSDLDYPTYVAMLGQEKSGDNQGESLRTLFQHLVNDYTRGRITPFLSLELRGEEVPPWQLGCPDSLENKSLLGSQLWAVSKPRTKPMHVDMGVL